MSEAPNTDTIFYDGHCALCHGTVRFVLAADRAGQQFRFAPLGGDTFQRLVPENARHGLPDSVVVLAADGTLVTRSAAVIYILRRLGGVWRIVAAALHLVPERLRDRVYDRVAYVRYRLFGRRAGVCPIMSAELGKRFDP